MLKRKTIKESPKIINAVSGSHGFIGTHLWNRLIASGESVIRLDRTGNLPYEVTDLFDLGSFGNKFDQTDTEEIYKANLDRVANILSKAEDMHSMIFTSSSSVLLPIQTDYSKAKTMMETMVKDWVAGTNENAVIVRPSTIIGIGENPKHLIPKLIHSCFTGEPIDFVGEPTHDFLDVEDFVDALILLSNRASDYKGHVFNVSFGVSVTNEFIKDVVEDITKKQANIRRVKSLRPYDTDKWEVNNDKLRSLGWRPQKLLWNTIKDMVEDYTKI